MAQIAAVVIGLLLVVLGGFAYAAAEAPKSVTALIPAFFGAPIFVLGVLAYAKPVWLKHVMHVVSVLALLGVVLPAGRLAMTMGDFELNLASGSLLVMLILSAILLAACVKSFIDARRARQSESAR
ncbi:MAG: hypothetical protein ACF8PN_10270 [Phycisphaerales bacterium]